MSTYHVSKTGNSAWDGTSPVYVSGVIGPKDTIAHGIALMAAGGGDTLLIQPGVYNEPLNSTASGLDSSHYYTISKNFNYPGDVIIRPTSGLYSVNIVHNYWQVTGLRVDGDYGITSANFRVNAVGAKANVCIIRGGTHLGNVYVTGATSSVTFNNCNIIEGQNGVQTFTAGCSATLINCIITGHFGYGLRNDGGTITRTNSVVFGNTTGTGGNTFGSITDGGGNLSLNPKFKSYSKPPGWVVLACDYQDQWKSNIFKIMNNYGLHGTWWVPANNLGSVTPYTVTGLTIAVNATAKTFTRSSGSFLADGIETGDWVTFSGFTGAESGNNGTFICTFADVTALTFAGAPGLVTCSATSGITASNEPNSLQSVYDAGNELGCLGYLGANETYTNAFTLISTATPATCQITGTTMTIIDSNGTHSLNLTSYGTMALLRTAVNTLTGNTMTLVNANYNPRPKALADTVGAIDISTVKTFTFDTIRLIDSEAGDGKMAIEALVHGWGAGYTGYVCKSQAMATDATNSTIQAELAALGFDGTKATVSGPNFLPSVNLMSIESNAQGYLYTAGDATATKTKVRQYAEWCAASGFIGCIYIQLGVNPAVSDLQNAYSELGLLKSAGVCHIGSFAEMVEAIKADHTSVDNITWTRTYTDQLDLNIKDDSPCINTGIESGISRYYDGLPVGAQLNIGALGSRPSGWFLFF